MTIKEFAKLCDCNPQTLRYYDSIDLLKPVNVDSWTGYRYYDEEQAVTFVKIKNLQKAGFSIEEVKELVRQDDLAIAAAFDAKIAEAEAHLQEIKTIRKSYLTEMNTMKEKINAMIERIQNDVNNYDPREEFGISPEEYDAICKSIAQCMAEAADSAENMPDFELPPADVMNFEPPKEPDFRTDPTYQVVYEKHGWANVKDFLPEIKRLEDGEYGLDFLVNADKYANIIAFSNTMLGILLAANEDRGKTLNCNVEKTVDGQNHFRLYKKICG